MAIANDSQLAGMAADRARPLFPVMERAGGMTPLVVLFCVLPGVYALEHYTPSEADALRGLRCLELLQSVGLVEQVDGPANAESPPFDGPSSLAEGLAALAMWLIGPTRPVGLVLVSYVSTAALVGVTYLLLRSMAGDSTAFWGAILASCHPLLLEQVQNPASGSFAVLWGLLAVWSWRKHLEERATGFAWELLLSGVALGMCLLSGGLMAPAVVVVLLVFLMARIRIEPARAAESKDEPAATVRAHRSAWWELALLLIVLVIAATVGGWPARLAGWLQRPLPSDWLSDLAALGGMRDHSASELPADFDALGGGRALAVRFVTLVGGLFGLCLYGVWQAGAAAASPQASRRKVSRALLGWLLSGFVLWAAWVHLAEVGDDARVWDTFFLVPCVAIAAFGLEEIRRRNCPSNVAVLVLAVSLAGTLWAAAPFSWARIVSEWIIISSGLVAAWFLWQFCRERDDRQRQVVAAAFCGLLVVYGLLGLRSVRNDDSAQEPWRGLTEHLAAHRETAQCRIVAANAPPPRLRFLLEGLWPGCTSSMARDLDDVVTRNESGVPILPSPIILVTWGANTTKPRERSTQDFQIEPVVPETDIGGQPLRIDRLVPFGSRRVPAGSTAVR